MRFLSPLLTRVAYPVMAKARYFSGWHARNSRGPLTVVTYHGVFPEGYEAQDPLLDGNLVTQKSLRDQLRLLKSRYYVIKPQEFLDFLDKRAAIPANSVLLTCDDGLQNVITDMLPVLKELELSCLFFITGASTQTAPQMLWYEELWMLFQLARGKTLSFPHHAVSVERFLRIAWNVMHPGGNWWVSFHNMTLQCAPIFLCSLQSPLGSPGTGKRTTWSIQFDAGDFNSLCETRCGNW